MWPKNTVRTLNEAFIFLENIAESFRILQIDNIKFIKPDTLVTKM